MNNLNFTNANNETTKRFYHIKDMVKIFDVSRATIYEWMKKGILPYMKIGGKTIFTEENINSAVRGVNINEKQNLKHNLMEESVCKD